MCVKLLRDHPCCFRNLDEVTPRTPYCPTFSYLRAGEGQGGFCATPRDGVLWMLGEGEGEGWGGSESHVCLLVFDSSTMKKISSFAL